MFYIKVYSGLNNKLIPLLSLLRISNKENHQIQCLWEPDIYNSKILFQFDDLFNPIQNITFIDKNTYLSKLYDNKLIVYNRNGSDRDRTQIIYSSSHKDSVFNSIVHLISYKEDNVLDNFVPYPRSIVQKNQFIDEMRIVIKKLMPTNEIMDKILSICEKFKNFDVLGIHIRSTDGGFVDIPTNDVYNAIAQHLKQPNSKVYISCDNLKLEKNIIDKFKDNILYFDNPFGHIYNDKFDRKTFGIKNAVCELFILSKTNSFLATPGSSFSFMVWLLRNEDFLNFWCNNPW